MTDKNFVMRKLQEHYDAVEAHEKGEVFAVMLYGSQNYCLGTPDSDVDSKAMVLPTKEALVLGKKGVSYELTMPDGALCNVKDVRLMCDNFMKGNVNFVECLYTPYVVVNPKYQEAYTHLRAFKDEFATLDRANLARMMAGMAQQKYVAFEKPFESKKEVLAKYGYDPKQLHHLARLNWMMDMNIKGENFARMLWVPEPFHSVLMDLKANPLPYHEAREYADRLKREVDAKYEYSKQMDPHPEFTAQKKDQLRHDLDDFLVKFLLDVFFN